MATDADPSAPLAAIPRVEVRSTRELWAWLGVHEHQSGSVWLVTGKKSAGDAYVPYGDIVDAALAHGWVDSLPRALDEHRTMHLLSPRRPGSAWSQVNRARVARLTEAGRMTARGLEVVARAKANGDWDRLDPVESLDIPADLKAALAAAPPAAEHFAAFPRSSQRLILEWIATAKRAETRAARILDTAEKARANLRANHYRQPKSRSGRPGAHFARVP